jgi:hypothetical protein
MDHAGIQATDLDIIWVFRLKLGAKHRSFCTPLVIFLLKNPNRILAISAFVKCTIQNCKKKSKSVLMLETNFYTGIYIYFK